LSRNLIVERPLFTQSITNFLFTTHHRLYFFCWGPKTM
jgi:hypothetical protein